MPSNKYSPRNWRAKDISGQRFVRLVALHPTGSHDGNLLWLCQCDCGNTKIVEGKLLRNGHTQSCGCLHDDLVRQRNTTHGRSKTGEYRSWCNMIQRCGNPHNPNYADYGGRGIQVCRRWRESFAAFIANMGPRPSPQHTIERRENNTGYTPENCYWGSRKAQARNTRTNHLLTYDGVTQCLSAWEEQLGFPPELIRKRLRRGWSLEKALTVPRFSKFQSPIASYNGTTKHLGEFAKEAGKSYDVVRRRLKRGWSVEKALTTPVTAIRK